MDTGKPSIPNKTTSFGTRMTDEEKQMLYEVAAAKGMRPTAWITDMVRREHAKLKKPRRPTE